MSKTWNGYRIYTIKGEDYVLHRDHTEIQNDYENLLKTVSKFEDYLTNEIKKNGMYGIYAHISRNHLNELNYLLSKYNKHLIYAECMPKKYLINKEKMKPMIYRKERILENLYSDTYRGFNFYVLNLGTHPTAYVEIPKGHKLFNKDYRKIDIDVHGGLTYSDSSLYTSEEKVIKNSWFIGWDYSHCTDYYPDLNDGKKWTTEEMIEDCIYVINQLFD